MVKIRFFLLFPQAGELEPTLIPMQMTVHGCPLYFQLTGPRPHEQNLGPIIQSVPLLPFNPSLTVTTYI